MLKWKMCTVRKKVAYVYGTKICEKFCNVITTTSRKITVLQIGCQMLLVSDDFGTNNIKQLIIVVNDLHIKHFSDGNQFRKEA